MSSKNSVRREALRYLSDKFDDDKKYTEKEVNQVLNEYSAACNLYTGGASIKYSIAGTNTPNKISNTPATMPVVEMRAVIVE